VKVDRKRRIPVTVLLRAIDIDETGQLSDEELGTDDRVRALLEDLDTDDEHPYLESTLSKDPTSNRAEALEEFYRRLRPGDPPTLDNARELLETLFFTDRRYDLGRVGRYKLNKRLGLVDAPEDRTLRRADLIAIVRASGTSTTAAAPRTTSTTWATAACAPWAS
jgi:DNA-directed RNA polymerase subunit beta